MAKQHDAHIHTYRWSFVEPILCDTCERKSCPDQGMVEECGWEGTTMTEPLKQIIVDFNVGQNDEGLMRLNTRGSIESLRTTGAQVGEYVILFDGDDCWVKALLVKQEGDVMYGKFDWDDIATIDEVEPNE